MPALAATLVSTVLAALSLATTRRQPSPPASPPDDAMESQTILYLLLGALLGVAYSLGTEKFMRAMTHRHVFVRNAMLCLAAEVSLLGLATVALVANKIYKQSGEGLEGFDRVLGILIPFVVRADLIVDWARRVASALLSVLTWTQATVQLRRLMFRAATLRQSLTISDTVVQLMPQPGRSPASDLISAEHTLWSEDADSLIHVQQVLDHFAKLGRVASYALAALVIAIPAACVWVVYAIYFTLKYALTGFFVLAVLYFLSIILAFPCAIAVIAVSAGLLFVVVTMSVIGTVIQFAVYWCTRLMYSSVRLALSQTWAGFPVIRIPHSHLLNSSTHPDLTPVVKDTTQLKGLGLLRALRIPEEAGAAMALLGNQLPTELEFALASWDGKDKGHKSKPFGFSMSRHLISTNCFSSHHVDEDDDDDDEQGEQVVENEKEAYHARRQRHGSCNMDEEEAGEIQFHENNSHFDVEDNEDDDMKTASETMPMDEQSIVQLDDGPSYTSRQLEQQQPQLLRCESQQEQVRRMLKMIGLDRTMKSPRRRCLSTFYALGMLVNLQIESGGNAWCLHEISCLSEDQFRDRISALNSSVADEAHVAVRELSGRLRTSTKYQVVPSGPPIQRMIPVENWLQSVLLLFLE